MGIGYLLLIQGIAVVLIFIFLRMLLYRDVQASVKRLQLLHRENLQKEAALNKGLVEVKHKREEEAKKGRAEAEIMRAQAKGEVEKVRDDAMRKAHEDAEKIIALAKEEREKIRKQAESRIREEAVGLAQHILRSFLSETSREGFNSTLVDELIQEISKLDRSSLHADSKEAEIVTMQPLSDKQKKELSAVLKEKLGFEPQLKERVDKSIMGGFVINIGGLMFDGTFAGRLNMAIRQVRKTQVTTT